MGVDKIELVYVAIITTVGGLIGLLYLDKSFYRRLQWKKTYEEDLLKLKKREGRKDKKLAATINTAPPMDKIDTIKNLVGSLDNPLIQSLIKNAGGGSPADEYDEPEEDIAGTLLRLAKENPDVVKGLADGFLKGKQTENTQTNIYEG